MTAKKTEALELAGLWRRAARCWLDVMDSSTDDAERERVAQRRERCIVVALKIRAFVNFPVLIFH
ncbi:PerC family transcriptional regulator [Serratia sp. PAMC26656]|uniref:PerC family transcriptional regulator n=1 Tax=Serratia sp. PAMC26656 TaxID=2775909 RepID=UPI0018F68F00|nr:PerC family transcriptional regulator [Serratia sp. PAMC26656]MBJ7892831.1 PerC family transcriptional regulator [Serratia sp. PAMC26656]